MEDKILLTARYANGDLDELAHAEFERNLKNDLELQQHLAAYETIHGSLQGQLSDSVDDQKFKATLAEMGNTYFGSAEKVFLFKPYLKWISSAAALLILGFMLWAPWENDLYGNYKVESKMMVAERGNDRATDLERAAALFNQKEYATARPLLEQLNAQSPADAMIAYYYGLSLIELDRLPLARRVLAKLYEGESVLKYDSAYAIALSYLKVNQKSECKSWLQKIPAGTTPYLKANELIKKL